MAHKKGVGSSRNGRDSDGQRLGCKKFGGEVVRAGNIRSIPAIMSGAATTTRCLRSSTVLFSTSDWAGTAKKFLFTLCNK